MIQVIDRAIDIMEFVAIEPQKPKFLGEIADAVGLKISTCATIVKTLVARRFLEQAGPKRGYTIGAGLYALSGTENYQQHIVNAAREDMQHLTEQLNENVLLAVLNGNQRLVLHRTHSLHELQVQTPVAKDAYNSASGRLLIAFKSDTHLENYLNRYGLPTADIWPEASERGSLWESVFKIRQNELAVQKTPNKQVFGLAVPVRKASQVIASLSVYMPIYRWSEAIHQKAITHLRHTAEQISSQLE